MQTQLSDHPQLQRDGHRFASGDAREPAADHGLQLHLRIVTGLRCREALEASQRGRPAAIGIAEGPFESQEPGDVPGQLRLREPGHAGSARATSRRRSVATRRYAEVDSGRR